MQEVYAGRTGGVIGAMGGTRGAAEGGGRVSGRVSSSLTLGTSNSNSSMRDISDVLKASTMLSPRDVVWCGCYLYHYEWVLHLLYPPLLQ